MTARLPPAALATLLLLSWIPGAAALTLAEVVGAAVELQPGAELASARAAEGAALARQAGSLFAADPTLGVQHYNDGIGSGDGAREWEAGVSVPVWLPGQRAARRGVAGAATRQADGAGSLHRWQVAGEVRRRLWEVLAASRRAARLEQALADARTLESSVARRVAAGDLARPELLLARREALTRAAVVVEARGAEQLARARWRSYTGIGELPEPALEDEAPAADVDATHPGLAVLYSAAVRAAAERDRARSERRASPVVSVGGRHERGLRTEPWNDTIAIGLEVPLGLPSQTAPAVSAAEVTYTEASLSLRRAQLALAEQLGAARSELEHARAALVLLREAATAAAESEQRAQAAFELGEDSLLALLQVRAQAQDAQSRLDEMDLRVGSGIATVNQLQGLVPL